MIGMNTNDLILTGKDIKKIMECMAVFMNELANPATTKLFMKVM
jgi:hypothetical protein